MEHMVSLHRQPDELLSVPGPSRWLLSIFKQSSNYRGSSTRSIYVPYKIPFSTHEIEKIAFLSPNPRLGGFGPFFSGVFVLALIIVILCCRLYEDTIRVSIYLCLFVISVVIVSASIMPMGNVARFIPQVFLIPVIVSLLLLKLRTKSGLVLGMAVLTILYINLGFIAKYHFQYQIEESRKILGELEELRDKSLLVSFKEFGSTKIKLEKYDIKYNEMLESSICLGKKFSLTNSVSELCFR